MALIKADRVKESSTSTGASTFALAGAYTGFRSFSSVCSVGDTFYYVIDSDLGSEWETGLGTYSAVNTLTRTTVHSSSNSNNIVTFSAGTKNVYISLTGNQLGTLSTLAGSEILTNKTINASNNTITNVSLTSGVTGTLPLANGGTGTTTAQLAINAIAGAVTSGSYLRGNGTNVVMAAIQAGDVPTLNQNTTGTASGSVSGTASYLAKFTGTNVVGNSLIYDSGTNVGIGTASPSGRVHISATGTAEAKIEGTTAAYLSFIRSGVNFGYVGLGSSGNSDIYIYNLNSGAVRINNQAVFVTAANLVGVNEQSPGAQLQVTTGAAATKGLIVKGASAQSANLLELQNSAGTTLATVDANGNISAASVFTNGGYKSSYTAEYVFYRAAPTTVGNYIEICNLDEQRTAMQIMAVSDSGAGIGATHKIYNFVSAFATGRNTILTPITMTRQSGYESTFDFEIEVWSDGTNFRLRLRRTAGTSARNVAIYIKTLNISGTGALTSATGTGTSSIGATYSYGVFGAYLSAPPVIGTSGSGNSLGIYASNAAGTGNGGSITLYTGAGAGGGVGGAILSRSQADSYNRSNKFILVRSIPDTVGNYVELGRIGWQSVVLKVSVFASRAAYDVGNGSYNNLGKEYEFYSHYYTSGTVAPRTISGNSIGVRQPNEFELELAWNTNGYQVLRLRRSKADATNFSGYTATVVIEQLIWSPHAFEFVELSGTGTSALTNAYLTNTGTYCYPALIPPPTGGTSGAGTDLAIYGGSAIGTGAGGNILLQSGAFSTSGSNGKVIVRGLASNTANLQEWQNNAGTVLAYLGSDGTFNIQGNTPLRMNGEYALYHDVTNAALWVGTTSNFAVRIYAGSGSASYPRLSMPSGNGRVGVNVISPSAGLELLCWDVNTKGIVVRAGSGTQVSNLQEWQNNAGTVLSAIKPDGSIQPASMADSAATNNSIYYSTTASKLVYKDAAGTVNNLY